MLKSYLTIRNFGESSIIIRKSVFIGYAKQVKNEDEAIEFINQIKKKHWDATHNCSAYVIGENDQIQRANDDGEPSGTAGKPILEVIRKIGLKDTVVVVTRYFGGIMLGAGGLIRAYGKAAKAGIVAAGIIERILYRKLAIKIDYTWYGKLENEMNNRGYTIYETAFADNVIMTVLAAYGEEDALAKLITNLTNGQAVITFGDVVYIDREYQAMLEEDQESSDS